MRIASILRTLFRATPLVLVACASGGHSRGGRILLPCPRANPAAAEASVDQAGDEIAVRGHRFRLQQGSVRGTTHFRVQDRVDGYAGVDITPHATQFEARARLTLSYARCRSEAAGFRTLQIVEVTPGGTDIIRELGGDWDRRDMTVTVELDHLSGYLISGT